MYPPLRCVPLEPASACVVAIAAAAVIAVMGSKHRISLSVSKQNFPLSLSLPQSSAGREVERGRKEKAVALMQYTIRLLRQFSEGIHVCVCVYICVCVAKCCTAWDETGSEWARKEGRKEGGAVRRCFFSTLT